MKHGNQSHCLARIRVTFPLNVYSTCFKNMHILRAFGKTLIITKMSQQKTKKGCRIQTTSRGSFQTIKLLKPNKIKMLFSLKLSKNWNVGNLSKSFERVIKKVVSKTIIRVTVS